MDEDTEAAAAHQYEMEGRQWHEEQLRREADAFERLMAQLWAALQTQWRTDRAESE